MTCQPALVQGLQPCLPKSQKAQSLKGDGAKNLRPGSRLLPQVWEGFWADQEGS